MAVDIDTDLYLDDIKIESFFDLRIDLKLEWVCERILETLLFYGRISKSRNNAISCQFETVLEDYYGPMKIELMTISYPGDFDRPERRDTEVSYLNNLYRMKLAEKKLANKYRPLTYIRINVTDKTPSSSPFAPSPSPFTPSSSPFAPSSMFALPSSGFGEESISESAICGRYHRHTMSWLRDLARTRGITPIPRIKSELCKELIAYDNRMLDVRLPD